MNARAVKILAPSLVLAGGHAAVAAVAVAAVAVAGHPSLDPRCQDGMLSLRAHPLPDLSLETGHKSVN